MDLERTPEWPPIDREFQDPPVVACPICGSPNVHLGPVSIVSGNAALRVSGDCKAESIPWGENRRGASVSLDMWCEGGWHHWAVVLEFHKGSTMVGWERLADHTTSEADELWRD